VFSSGFVFAFPEAEIMRALAVDNGVPASAIELETRAANTHKTSCSHSASSTPTAGSASCS
jgi:hypothetical protein